MANPVAPARTALVLLELAIVVYVSSLSPIPLSSSVSSLLMQRLTDICRNEPIADGIWEAGREEMKCRLRCH